MLFRSLYFDLDWHITFSFLFLFFQCAAQLQSVIKNFKLPAYVVAASLDTAGLKAVYAKRGSHYQPLSRYPSTSRDLSLKVPAQVNYASVHDCVKYVIDSHQELQIVITPISIYQPDGDNSTKTVTFNIKFTSLERTLTDKDITPIIEGVVAAAAKLGAVQA